VQQLVSRYHRECWWLSAAGPAAARTHAVDADAEDAIVRLRKELSKQGLDAGAKTIAAHLAAAAGVEPAMLAVSTIWRTCPDAGLLIRNRRNRPVELAHVLRRAAQRNARKGQGRKRSAVGADQMDHEVLLSAMAEWTIHRSKLSRLLDHNPAALQSLRNSLTDLRRIASHVDLDYVLISHLAQTHALNTLDGH
jgi:hypothetical protein